MMQSCEGPPDWFWQDAVPWSYICFLSFAVQYTCGQACTDCPGQCATGHITTCRLCGSLLHATLLGERLVWATTLLGTCKELTLQRAAGLLTTVQDILKTMLFPCRCPGWRSDWPAHHTA